MQKDKKNRTQGPGEEESKGKPATKKKAVTTVESTAKKQGNDTNKEKVTAANAPTISNVDPGTGGTASKKASAKSGKSAPLATPPVAGTIDAGTASKIAGITTKKPATKQASPAIESEAKPAKSTGSKAAAPKKSSSLTKIYGQIRTSGNNVLIEKGSIQEGPYQLTVQKDNQALVSRLSGYNDTFVTVLGELGKKNKDAKVTSFVVQQIASHDEIARRAYEISQRAESSEQDNWLQAENELLQQK